NSFASDPLCSIIKFPFIPGFISGIDKSTVGSNQRFFFQSSIIIHPYIIPAISQAKVQIMNQFVIKLCLKAVGKGFSLKIVKADIIRIFDVHHYLFVKTNIVIVYAECTLFYYLYIFLG